MHYSAIVFALSRETIYPPEKIIVEIHNAFNVTSKLSYIIRVIIKKNIICVMSHCLKKENPQIRQRIILNDTRKEA